jgi:hypothetical protein
MGKDLVPRFKCPLCGWLAYYSMLEKGPHKIEVRGMKYGGFQEISYHHVWGVKKDYKKFLRIKVRELAKKLGIRLADEELDEEITDDEEDEEIDLEVLGLGTPSSTVIGTPSRNEQRKTFATYVRASQNQVDSVNVHLTEEDRQIVRTNSRFIDLGGEDNG